MNLWRRRQYWVKSFQRQATSTAYTHSDLHQMKLQVLSAMCRHFVSWILSSASTRSPARPWSTRSRSWPLTFQRGEGHDSWTVSCSVTCHSGQPLCSCDVTHSCILSTKSRSRLITFPQGQGHDSWTLILSMVTFFDLVNFLVLVISVIRLFFVHKFKVTDWWHFWLWNSLSMTRSSLVQTVKVTGGLASTGQSTRPSMPRGRKIWRRASTRCVGRSTKTSSRTHTTISEIRRRQNRSFITTAFIPRPISWQVETTVHSSPVTFDTGSSKVVCYIITFSCITFYPIKRVR